MIKRKTMSADPSLVKIITFDSLLHILILFMILSLIFWLLIGKVATKNIRHQLNIIIRSAFQKLDPEKKQVVINYVDNNREMLTDALHYYQNDSFISRRNNKTVLSTNIAIICLMVFNIMIVFGTVYFFSPQKAITLSIIKHVFIENIIIFTCLALIEVTIFISIVLHYSAIMPSEIGKIFFNQMNTIRNRNQ